MHITRILQKNLIRGLPRFIRKRLVRSRLQPLDLDLADITFRPAIDLEDYLNCFRLLHDVYVQAGYIQPSETALRIIPHHSNPESKVFLGCHGNCKSGQTPVYTISLFPDSKKGLPMDEAFHTELDRLRDQGRRLAEVGCLASHPTFRKGDMNIPMLGNRIIHQHASANLDLDDLVITIHPRYLWVYEDLLLFEKIGQIGSYGYVNGNPAVAMRLDLRTMEKEYKKAYAAYPLERDLHHFFFSASSSSIDLSSEEQPLNVNVLGAVADYYASLKNQ